MTKREGDVAGEARHNQDMKTHRTRAEFSDSIKDDIKRRADPEAAEAQKLGTAVSAVGTPENPSNDIFTVSNVITFCRFLLTMAFLYLFAKGGHRVEALVCYAVAAMTDFLDGYIARTTHTVSWLGKIFDPVMDRVLLFSGVLGLVLAGELPVWIAVFVIGRDVYLLVCAIRLQRYRKRPIDVIYLGKLATALFMFGFCGMLLGVPVVPGFDIAKVHWLPGLDGVPVAIGIFFVYAAMVCSSHATAIYVWLGYRYKEEAKAEAAALQATQPDGQVDGPAGN